MTSRRVLCGVFAVIVLFKVSECCGESYNVESPVSYFVNQIEYINELEDKLNNQGVVHITGARGIGKTELIKKYYAKNSNKYSTALYLNGEISLIPQLISFAEHINNDKKVNYRILLEPFSIKDNILEFLRVKQNWLIILDNFSLRQLNDFKVDALKNRGHIIYVSSNIGKNEDVITIQELKIEYVKKLIEKIMKIPDQTVIDELSKILVQKGCPTALIVDSAYFLSNNPHYTVSEYIAKITANNSLIKNYLEMSLKTISDEAKTLLMKIALLNNQQISKNVISSIIADPTKTNEVITELLNTNLLRMINIDREKPIFSVHDIYKYEINQLSDLKAKQKLTDEIITGLNKLFPLKFKNGSEVRKVFASDPTLFGNTEILITNIKRYSLRENFNTLELVLNLLLDSIEYCYMDKYYECVQWFKVQLEKKTYTPATVKERTTFGAILINLAAYEFFDNINTEKALEYLYFALKITGEDSEFDEMRSYIHTDLAQILIIQGKIQKARESIILAERLITNEASGIVKILYVKALINLYEGKFAEALKEIDEEIALCNKFGFSDQNPPLVALKTRILNSMSSFNEAYIYINQWYLNNLKDFSNYATDDKSTILIQLSKAELGLNMINEALEHSNQALKFLAEDKKRNNMSAIDKSLDTYFADGLVVHADVLSKLGKLNKALSEYNKAEKIYKNAYQENFVKIDGVSYLIGQAAKVAFRLGDKLIYNHYNNLLKENVANDNIYLQNLRDFELNSKLGVD